VSGVRDLGCRAQGHGLGMGGVQALRFMIYDSRVLSSNYRVWGLGFRVYGSGLGVWG